MRRHCFPKKGWTSYYCRSKLIPLDLCKSVTVVKGVGVVIDGGDGVVVGVIGCVCFVAVFELLLVLLTLLVLLV